MNGGFGSIKCSCTLGQVGNGYHLSGLASSRNEGLGSRNSSQKEMNADMAKLAKAQELFEREVKKCLSDTAPSGIPAIIDFFVKQAVLRGASSRSDLENVLSPTSHAAKRSGGCSRRVMSWAIFIAKSHR